MEWLTCIRTAVEYIETHLEDDISVQDIADVLTLGKADAALAASIFHYGRYTVSEVKWELERLGIPVRLTD